MSTNAAASVQSAESLLFFTLMQLVVIYQLLRAFVIGATEATGLSSDSAISAR